MLTIALPTGRVMDDCLDILQLAGLPVAALKAAGRGLIIEDGGFRYILSKPSDVPAMVHYGAADMALAGSDVIAESGIPLVELLDTGRGQCFMAVAGTPCTRRLFEGSISELMGLKVATKYTKTAKETFEAWGVQIKLLKLGGSLELAPALGLADCIFDIVQTGKTLSANGLVVIKKTASVSIRLVTSFAAAQLKMEKIKPIRDLIKGLMT